MGGTSGYSTAINGLASWFDEGRIKDPVIVDGLAPSLVFLTGGRIGDVTERQDCNHESYRAESRRLLAKGADYALEAIVGADLVTARGGRVVQVPLAEGVSTTTLIARALRDET